MGVRVRFRCYLSVLSNWSECNAALCRYNVDRIRSINTLHIHTLGTSLFEVHVFFFFSFHLLFLFLVPYSIRNSIGFCDVNYNEFIFRAFPRISDFPIFFHSVHLLLTWPM